MPDDLAPVRRWVKEVLPDAGGVAEVPGGERHRLFVVGDPPRAVVRLNVIATERARHKARTEAAVLAFLDGRLAPRLLAFAERDAGFQEPVMAVEWVEGRPRRLADLAPTELATLGTGLRELHGLDATALVLDPRPAATARDALLANIGEVAAGLPPELDAGLRGLRGRALAAAEESVAAGAFDGPAQTALLHGDLSEGNIVWDDDGRPRLIDWEDARPGDPAEELAYLFNENGLDTAARDHVLAGYGADDALRARLEAWLPVMRLASVEWWVGRYVAAERGERLPSDAASYLRGAQERLG